MVELTNLKYHHKIVWLLYVQGSKEMSGTQSTEADFFSSFMIENNGKKRLLWHSQLKQRKAVKDSVSLDEDLSYLSR